MNSFGYPELKFIVIIACFFIIPGLSRGMTLFLNMSLNSNPAFFIGLLLIAIGFVLHNKFLIKYSYFNTYNHEAHHAIMGAMCGRGIKRYVVTADRGGLVRYTNGSGGPVADFLCNLAPYCIPFYLTCALIAETIVPAEFKFITHCIIYLMIGSYLSIQYQDTKLAIAHPVFLNVDDEYMKSDLNYIGFVSSFIFIITVNALIYSSVLVYLNNGLPDTLGYLKFSFYASVDFWSNAIYLLKVLLKNKAGNPAL